MIKISTRRLYNRVKTLAKFYHGTNDKDLIDTQVCKESTSLGFIKEDYNSKRKQYELKLTKEGKDNFNLYFINLSFKEQLRLIKENLELLISGILGQKPPYY